MKRIEFIFEICRSATAKQQWYWRCKAQNGQIRCHSENYASKASAVNSVKSFVRHFKAGVARIDESWRVKK